MKSQPTSVRIPTGELLCVWVSESLSPYLSTSPLLSSPPSWFSPSLLSYITSVLASELSHVSVNCTPVFFFFLLLLLQASLVIGINTSKLNGCTDLLFAGGIRQHPSLSAWVACLFVLAVFCAIS